jgi:HAD superfamily hydrolase (TIGR01509 family)
MNRLVIFDMDGVLLNSEKLYLEMNQHWFKEIGVNLPIEKHQTFVGISAKKMWHYLKEENNLSESVETYIELEKELKNKTLRTSELVPTQGVVHFLEFLKKNNCTLAIASSGLLKNIELILSKLNMVDYFDLIVSGEQVAKGKPEPDIFLKVSTHFKQHPEKCIVIEDSANGVKAAKSAGMYCVGYYNPDSGNQDLSTSDLIIDSFADERLFDLISSK